MVTDRSFTEGPGYIGDEDCLFLNVYSPLNAYNLPVFVFERKFWLLEEINAVRN